MLPLGILTEAKLPEEVTLARPVAKSTSQLGVVTRSTTMGDGEDEDGENVSSA